MHFGMVAMYRSSVNRVATLSRIPCVAAAIVCCAAIISSTVWAQESAPITIDASPTATELLRRAHETASTNPNESARVLQEAVDRFPNKLVPWDDSTDRFQNTIDAAERFLLSNQVVLQSWLRAESATAQRRLDQGDVLRVVELRALSPAGLQGMLWLAQQELDQGRIVSARRWIEKALRHPSLSPQQKLLLDQAKIGISTILIPSRVSATTSSQNETSQQQEQKSFVWGPLWKVWLPGTWLNRSLAELEPQSMDAERKKAAINGSALVSQSRFTWDGVLIAEGASVRYLDRISGVERWQQSVGSPMDRVSAAPVDLSVAVPAGDLVITLPGQALSEQRSGGQARITALSLQTGALRWDIHLDRLGRDDLKDLFPHGDPLIMDDVVIVQARKNTTRLEIAEWLIALDRATGAVIWTNSLGAAGGDRLSSSRPLGSPTQFNGDVIAATSLGVVARIDAFNGHVIWMKRWSAPTREPRFENPAWQLPSPIVSNDCVFWIQPDQMTLVCLSAIDGSTKWSAMLGVSEQLPAARSLLADHERLYLLCEDVVAVDIEDPRRTIWKLSDRLKEPMSVRGQCALATDDTGRSLLAVPLQNKALLLDPATGDTLGELPLKAGGNLNLDNGQLTVVDAEQVSLFMQANVGERLLRERMAQDSTDPRRGLALFELGRAWFSSKLMLDGATAMSAAVNQNSSTTDVLRDELLTKLFDALVISEIDQDTRSQLLTIAKNTARSFAQKATVALRIGDLAASNGQLQDALEQWCAVLESTQMRHEIVGNEVWKTSAQTAAIERIVSHPQTATMKLRMDVAAHSLTHMRQSDLLGFINAVNTAALLACNFDQAREILNEAARLAQSKGWSQEENMCRAMNADAPTGARWPQWNSAMPFAQLGSAQPKATTLSGRMLSMSPQAQREKNRSSMLFAEASSIFLRSADNLGIVWRTQFGDRDPSIMSWVPHIVLWCPRSQEDGALLALNPKDGAEVWRVDSVASVFQNNGLTPLKVPVVNERTNSSEIACLRAGPVCALIRNDGVVAGVNIANGSTQWNLNSTIRALDAADSSSNFVVVGGRETATQEELTSNPSWIYVMGSEHGDVVAKRVLPEEWGQIRWLRMLPDCLMIATDEVIATLELAPNLPIRWSLQDRRYANAPVPQAAGSWCFIRDRVGNTTALSMATGRLSALPFVIPSGVEVGGAVKAPQPFIYPYKNSWLVKNSQRLSMHSDNGSLQGVDAVAVIRGYENIIVGDDAVFVVDGGGIGNPGEREFSNGSDVLLREFKPSQGLRTIGIPILIRGTIGRMTKTDAIDGWIFLGGEDKTIAIPAPLSH